MPFRALDQHEVVAVVLARVHLRLPRRGRELGLSRQHEHVRDRKAFAKCPVDNPHVHHVLSVLVHEILAFPHEQTLVHEHAFELAHAALVHGVDVAYVVEPRKTRRHDARAGFPRRKERRVEKDAADRPIDERQAPAITLLDVVAGRV